ncbi:WD40-repeat-containing domain protein [Cokeromyces recurvatus]|uniref:WD40-repeat-containing domain protein n=1 Tax=Cokeromyces recurvatus TaxID=90255 RepID=UPI00221F4AF9|nr:WD40-repeat-containing domain protein [Cokeromyces recurvatus]KAI7898745.1 WD40-repeat-containing domain protein [Cokeromyces recurvatus]
MTSTANVNQILQNYFYKKGYTPGELAFIQQQDTLSEHNILSLKQLNKKLINQDPEENDLDTLLHGYENLREWIFNALDLYRHIEKHGKEIESLEMIKTTDDVENNTTAILYLNNKYHIHMASIPFELFFHYIQENRFMRLIRIVNQHFHIHLATSKSSPASAGGSSGKKEGIVINEHNQQMDHQMDIDQTATVSFRGADIQAELDSLSDLRKRVSLGSAALPKDTTLIACGFSESFIKIWSLKGKKLQSKKEREADEPGTKYKNLDTFTNLVCYKSHNYPIWDVDFGPYGFYFATASHDKTARLWSCDHIDPLRIFAGHLSDVNTVRFHPNSKYVVTGSSDKTARLWDVQRGTCVRVFTGHTGSIHSVAISPNGRLMASGGEDQSILLWDLGTGKKLKAMTGHTGFIYSLSFSSDSTVLVSGSGDGTVRVWDVNKDTPYQNTYYSEESNSKKRTKYDKSNGKQQQQKDSKKEAEKIKLANNNDSSDNNNNKRKKNGLESNDHLSVFPTKNTPIYTVQFTQRNLCLAAGAMISSSLDL